MKNEEFDFFIRKELQKTTLQEPSKVSEQSVFDKISEIKQQKEQRKASIKSTILGILICISFPIVIFIIGYSYLPTMNLYSYTLEPIKNTMLQMNYSVGTLYFGICIIFIVLLALNLIIEHHMKHKKTQF